MKTKVFFGVNSAKKLLLIAVISICIAFCFFIYEYYTEASDGQMYFVAGLGTLFAFPIFLSVIFIMFNPIIIKDKAIISNFGKLSIIITEKISTQKRRIIQFSDIKTVELSSITIIYGTHEYILPVIQFELADEESVFINIKSYSNTQMIKILEVIHSRL